MPEKNDEFIRQVLLESAEEEFRLALAGQPENITFSPQYQTWEKDFLQDPIAWAEQKKYARGTGKRRVLSRVSCFLLIITLSLSLGIISGPHILAAVSQWIDPDPAPTATGLEISVQLGGPHGSVYTSEKFTCVKENGNSLRYWYRNNGTNTCTLQLYRVGLWRDEMLGEAFRIAPGEDAVGFYENPGNDTFYLRVTCEDGSGTHINGDLRADQYD